MVYATVQAFVDSFGQRETDMIADRNADGSYEPGVVQNALEDATQQINYAVAQRCQLPLPVNTSGEVLGMLRRWCLDIARYRLTGASGVVVTDDINDRYKETRADLDRIVSGKLLVCAPDSGGMSPENVSAGEAEFSAGGRVFVPGKIGYLGTLA